MTITNRVTQVFHGPLTAGAVVAPTIDAGLGVPASMAGTFSTTSLGTAIHGGDTTSTVTNLCGYRVVQAMDLSTREYVCFHGAHNNMQRQNLRTWADGGIRIVFEDTSGNWECFNIYGSDFAPFSNAAEGALAVFVGFTTNADATGSAVWLLSRNYTPVAFNGALDWSSIAAFEVHFRPNTGTRCQLTVGRFSTVESPLHTGAVSGNGFYEDIRNSYAASSPNWPLIWAYKRPAFFTQGAANLLRAMQLGVQIGDGSTFTTLSLSGDNVVLWHLPEDNTSTSDVPMPAILMDAPRLWDFFQSATDSVTLTDCVISTTRRWGVRVRGNTSGTCNFTRATFWNYEQFECGHGDFIDCTFNGGLAPVQITADSVLTGCVIRDVAASASALRVMGGPATYSNIDVRLDNASAVADIVVGNGGAGTYALPNIEVPAGYTLKVRNESASAAVVVQVPAGLTTSTSTAGGSITVESAAVEYTLTLTGLLADSEVRLYRDSDDVELAGVESSGTTWSYTYEYGGSAVAATLVIFKESRAPIRLPLSLGAGSTTLPIQQQLDRVFLNPA